MIHTKKEGMIIINVFLIRAMSFALDRPFQHQLQLVNFWPWRIRSGHFGVTKLKNVNVGGANNKMQRADNASHPPRHDLTFYLQFFVYRRVSFCSFTTPERRCYNRSARFHPHKACFHQPIYLSTPPASTITISSDLFQTPVLVKLFQLLGVRVVCPEVVGAHTHQQVSHDPGQKISIVWTIVNNRYFWYFWYF